MSKLINVKTKEEHPLRGEAVLIGRLPGSGVHVADKQVSRRHCRIMRSREGWILSDSGSTLGTYLNGELLTRPHRLQQGDKVKVGTAVFTFEEHAAPADAEMKLRPLSKASARDLVPRDVTEPPRRVLAPAILGGVLALVAVGTLVVVLVLTRQTPARVVARAAQLLRRRDAKQLWTLLSDERRGAMTFGEFADQVKAVPRAALDALATLDVGEVRRTDRGVIVPVEILSKNRRLTDEVVLLRERGDWKIHSVPTGRLGELAP